MDVCSMSRRLCHSIWVSHWRGLDGGACVVARGGYGWRKKDLREGKENGGWVVCRSAVSTIQRIGSMTR
jgi:hypothetical protein